jgi:hypothetical protein
MHSPALAHSSRLGSARLGSARLGSARLGSARLGSAVAQSAEAAQAACLALVHAVEQHVEPKPHEVVPNDHIRVDHVHLPTQTTPGNANTACSCRWCVGECKAQLSAPWQPGIRASRARFGRPTASERARAKPDGPTQSTSPSHRSTHSRAHTIRRPPTDALQHTAQPTRCTSAPVRGLCGRCLNFEIRLGLECVGELNRERRAIQPPHLKPHEVDGSRTGAKAGVCVCVCARACVCVSVCTIEKDWKPFSGAAVGPSWLTAR